MVRTELQHDVTSRQSLSWYAKRLRVMQPTELLSRIGSRCALTFLSFRHRLGWTSTRNHPGDPSRYRFCTSSVAQLPPFTCCSPLDAATRERVLAGGLAEAGWNWMWRQDAAVWHAAPDTLRTWPRQFFGSIPYREGNPYGDVRFVWEPSRLQQLVALGLIAEEGDAGRRDQAVALMEAQLLSWVDANPPLTGVHYVSAMECGLRLIAVCHAFDLVRSWLRSQEQVWPAVLGMVSSHAEFIRSRISLHSSVGNHTVAEAAALVYAGMLFHEMPGAGQWKVVGLALLESEAAHQVLSDGGGVEQGFWYLRFISDLYGLVRSLLASRQERVPEGIEFAFAQSRQFQAVVAGGTGQLPTIGDCDNGYALCPFLDCSKPAQRRKPGLRTFEVAGYSVVDAGQDQQASMILDHGPLGMAPCYAHGHADALSLTFRVGALEVLIDPGTFTYTGRPAWRRYFRSTRAHNTVVVDGLDQAVQETAFLWSSPYHSRLVYHDELPAGGAVLVAVHDGYRDRAGVMHWRGVLYQPPSLWLILDSLTGTGAHSLELNWHLGLCPMLGSGAYEFADAGAGLRLSVQGGTASLHRGETEPISGWRSNRYGSREPMDTLKVSYKGQMPHEFATCLWFGQQNRQEALAGCLARLRGLIHEAQTH